MGSATSIALAAWALVVVTVITNWKRNNILSRIARTITPTWSAQSRCATCREHHANGHPNRSHDAQHH